MSRSPLAAGEPGGRLVEHHESRLDGARHPDLELALLPVREVADERVRLGAEPDLLGRSTCTLATFAVAPARNDAQPPAVVADEREVDVVRHREAREQAGLLVRAGEPELGAHPRGQMRDVLPHHLDRARRRLEVAGDEVEEGRLAGPVRAEDRAALAVRDVEIDVAHGLDAAEAPADPPQAEDRLGARVWCGCRHPATSAPPSCTCPPTTEVCASRTQADCATASVSTS